MNIFEGITKEKFIEEFNKEGNGSLSLLHINLVFDYKGLKTRKGKYNDSIKLKSITNVKNYEEEIEVFNSFNPFVEYNRKTVLIIENYNKYLSYRKKIENRKLPETILRPSGVGFYFTNFGFYDDVKDRYRVFQDVKSFNAIVKDEDNRKLQVKIVKELSISIKEHKDKMILYLKERFVEFADKGYDFDISIEFNKFNELKDDKKLKEEHLIQHNFYDEFVLNLNNRDFYEKIYDFEDPMPIDEYLELTNEYLNTIKDLGEYLGCNVSMIYLFTFHFKKK